MSEQTKAKALPARIVKVDVHRRTWGRHMTYRDMNKLPRMYVDVAGENLAENLAFRMHRPVDVYKAMLPEVRKMVEGLENATFRWNQRAGCSCPCSPGFVVTGSSIHQADIFVTIEPMSADEDLALKVAIQDDQDAADVACRAERAVAVLTGEAL